MVSRAAGSSWTGSATIAAQDAEAKISGVA